MNILLRTLPQKQSETNASSTAKKKLYYTILYTILGLYYRAYYTILYYTILYSQWQTNSRSYMIYRIATLNDLTLRFQGHTIV